MDTAQFDFRDNIEKLMMKKNLNKSYDLTSICSTSSQECDEDLFMLKNKPIKHKTELCKNFSEKAQCPYGNKCKFAHGKHQLVSSSSEKNFKKYKCKSFWSKGYCPYGKRCQFGHQKLEWDSTVFLMTLSIIQFQKYFPEESKLLQMLKRL